MRLNKIIWHITKQLSMPINSKFIGYEVLIRWETKGKVILPD
ncbi:hypothetical protein [Photobacterium leiognathi]|nr:hypothetical protein [Photobacterium leiognathi]